MLIRLQQSLIELTEKLKDRFSDQDWEALSQQTIEANYEKLKLNMLGQELLQRRCRRRDHY